MVVGLKKSRFQLKLPRLANITKMQLQSSSCVNPEVLELLILFLSHGPAFNMQSYFY